MVDIKTAIHELNTGKIEFNYKDDDCCTTEGEVVVLLKRLEELETADVVEVKHGEWLDDIQEICPLNGIIPIKALVGYRCSVCNRPEFLKEPYCNCGAKMD